MGENSSIQWTHHTFNPWIGCQRVSPGCEHCYAEALDKRWGGVLVDGVKALRWGPKAPRVRTSPANWKKPLAWNRSAEKAGERHRVFCSSLADVFEDRPELVAWRAELFGVIAQTPHLDWLLLTKRPENITSLWPAVDFPVGARCYRPGSDWWPNVWLGTTVEDQQRANERIPALLEVPATVRFLSCEPLLEPVDLSYWLDEDKNGFTWRTGNAVQWVIIGGESGHGARPFDVGWARDLVRQCRVNDVAPFVKQLGAKPLGFCRVGPFNGCDDADFCDLYDAGESTYTCGAECRLRLEDSSGGDMAEWPEDLRVREFPVAAVDDALAGVES